MGKNCISIKRLGFSLRLEVFRIAFKMAVPNALVAGVLKALDLYGPPGVVGYQAGVLSTSAFSSFTFLIGLFIAFRASQAYGRFWEGTEAAFQMVADFFDVASSVASFCKGSTKDPGTVHDFKHTLVRLFSVLHALILAELEAQGRVVGTECALNLEVVDIQGLDDRSLELLRTSEEKVDLVFHWIQGLIVNGLHTQIIAVPAPILTRAFQELNAGMVQFHQALKITEVSIPFPYTAATEVMCLIHFLLTPLVAGTWTIHLAGAVVFAFVQVFMVWSLNLLAVELENPFGNDENDLDRRSLHTELNTRLLMLLEEESNHTPSLSSSACKDTEDLRQSFAPGILRTGGSGHVRGRRKSEAFTSVSKLRRIYSEYDSEAGNFMPLGSYNSRSVRKELSRGSFARSSVSSAWSLQRNKVSNSSISTRDRLSTDEAMAVVLSEPPASAVAPTLLVVAGGGGEDRSLTIGPSSPGSTAPATPRGGGGAAAASQEPKRADAPVKLGGEEGRLRASAPHSAEQRGQEASGGPQGRRPEGGARCSSAGLGVTPGIQGSGDWLVAQTMI